MVSQRDDQAVPTFSLRKICPYLIFSAVVVFGSFMGLGILRLYSFRLECRLNSINSQIESFQAQQISQTEPVGSSFSGKSVWLFKKTARHDVCFKCQNPSPGRTSSRGWGPGGQQWWRSCRKRIGRLVLLLPGKSDGRRMIAL